MAYKMKRRSLKRKLTKAKRVKSRVCKKCKKKRKTKRCKKMRCKKSRRKRRKLKGGNPLNILREAGHNIGNSIEAGKATYYGKTNSMSPADLHHRATYEPHWRNDGVPNFSGDSLTN